MRPPTPNDISQGKHGKYNAVDYRAKDRNNNWRKEIWAPCDMRISFYGDAGTAGLQIQAFDPSGRRHGFAHTERCLVKVGDNVKKGDLIGIMGYTGLTDPDNVPAGTHCHWTIRLPDGTYVYPLSLVTEPFERTLVEKPADYDFVANASQIILLRPTPMSREEYDKFHKGKTRQQIYDEFSSSEEAKGGRFKSWDYDRLKKEKVSATPKQLAAEKLVNDLKGVINM